LDLQTCLVWVRKPALFAFANQPCLYLQILRFVYLKYCTVCIHNIACLLLYTTVGG
jgi:hypothetical protein